MQTGHLPSLRVIQLPRRRPLQPTARCKVTGLPRSDQQLESQLAELSLQHSLSQSQHVDQTRSLRKSELPAARSRCKARVFPNPEAGKQVLSQVAKQCAPVNP